MSNSDVVEISRGMAIKIADIMKEELGRLDAELQHARRDRLGEITLNILQNRIKGVRQIYDELKAVGVEGLDATVDMLEPPT